MQAAGVVAIDLSVSRWGQRCGGAEGWEAQGTARQGAQEVGEDFQVSEKGGDAENDDGDFGMCQR